MTQQTREKKRLLIITPEITYLPKGMGNMANYLRAKAGGLADVSAALASELYEQGIDIHVALPHYRQMFNVNIGSFISQELRIYKSKFSEDRIHLAEDRIFYYRHNVYTNDVMENLRLALTFQREVINNIIPRVNPHLIHCNDWMTGLIPAAARRQGIQSLFTLHNIHSMKTNLKMIEEKGMDAREFFHNVYFDRLPRSFDESYEDNYVDLLATGIFSSDYINTVSPTFLEEVVNGQHAFVKDNIRKEVISKYKQGKAEGVLNSPDSRFDPMVDAYLDENYGPDNFHLIKPKLKMNLQQELGLDVDPNAALFFWPSRLDPGQKGCQLLTEILFEIVSRYYKQNLQVLVVANGPYQKYFREIVHMHYLDKRVCVLDFSENFSHRGYSAADYLFMPSLFEPCGLPQMIGPIYGTLPIGRNTGGIHDTVQHLDAAANEGNGFLFDHYDSQGLRWAVDQAMVFHHLPPNIRKANVARIMRESKARFNHKVTASRYIKIYRKILGIEGD